MIGRLGRILGRARRKLSKQWGVAPRRASGRRLHAQGLEDLYLRRVFGEVTKGFYVDVGAHDGRFVSNTFGLYQDGWQGICIEPNPVSFATLRRLRPRDICLNVGVGRSATPRILRWKTGIPEGSSFESPEGANAHVVRVESLHRIMTEHTVPPRFELLSVDVEGMEIEVLSTVDWAVHRPRVVIVEYNTQGKVVLESLDLLLPFGYRPILINRWNIMFSLTAGEDILKAHRRQEWYSLDTVRL